MITQLTLFPQAEPPPPAPLPYGACGACGVVTDWRTLPRLFGYPCWPLRCAACGAAVGFATFGPDRAAHYAAQGPR